VTVRFDVEGAVVVVTIDRPAARNAVDRPTAEALADAFRRFEDDAALSVAILTGAGGTFCAGADLKAIGTERGNRVERTGDGPMGPTRMLLTKPVIAAIEGHAVAGGLELACFCDLRVVAEDATLGVFCRRFGVPLIDGGTVRLPRIVGLGRALDLILTGRALAADEALAIGLATRVTAPGKALAGARELALAIAALPQTCMREDRLSTYEGLSLDLPEGLANELLHGEKSLAAPELVTMLGAFAAGAGRHGRKVLIASGSRWATARRRPGRAA
jgi:enoyl-CoA hydratase